MNSRRGKLNLDALALRASGLRRLRDFFFERNVLEVETPSLSEAATPDPHLESLKVAAETGPLYLHTSPEFGMKRLLVAGAGDIFQVCRVFRGGEFGKVHRREFTLVEWYRIGYSLEDLMTEVIDLCEHVGKLRLAPPRTQSFGAAFSAAMGLDWRGAGEPELRAALDARGIDAEVVAGKQELLELALATVVSPRLGHDTAEFLTDFPASMAALAELNPDNPDTAARFELFVAGIELANGFRELSDAAEQRRRFESELERRARRGLDPVPLDEQFLNALGEGLPPCSGVALGFDRLLMVANGLDSLDGVLAFPED